MAKATAKKKKSGSKIVPAHAAQKRVFGSIVLTRFANETIPAALAAAHKQFNAAHDELKSVSTAIADAQSLRAHAETQVADHGKKLDAAIHTLANALVGAGLGTRQNPFKGYSPHSPSRITKLAYARKVKEARAIVKKLKPKKMPASVGAAHKALGTRADAVAKALGAISKPGAVVGKARRSLEGVVVSWDHAMKRLKTLAAAAWIDAPETLATIFAKPEKVQAATKKRPKGAAAKKKAKTAEKKAASAAKKAAAAAKRAAAAAAKAPATTSAGASATAGNVKPST